MNAFAQDIQRQLGKDQVPTLAKSIRIIIAEYSLQALLAYRLGRWLLQAGRKPYLWPLLIPGWPLYFLISRYIRLAFDIRLHLSADIGPGLYISHFGGILVSHCSLGKHCSLTQSVRLGPDESGKGPTIGERVWIGAHAIIKGVYTIGNRSTVSAAAVVQRDIPDNALCMGNPARVVIRDYDNSGILRV